MSAVTRRIFIYEDTCGGGCEDPLPLQLRGEGMAMLCALCEDFAELENIEPVTTLDERLNPEDLPVRPMTVGSAAELAETFDSLAAECDLSLILAPELGGRLARLSRRVADVGGSTHGGDIALVETASDKLRLCRHLDAADVPTIPCRRIEPGRLSGKPIVLKPRFGAGSLEISTLAPGSPEPIGREELIATPLIEGMAASVLCIAGEGTILPLQPCGQRLSSDGAFSYLGGSVPLPGRELVERASELAARAVGSFAQARGFVGVDLLLGERAKDDRVVEINPRPTTSYCALRRRSSVNLARLSLELLDGNRPGKPAWPANTECFDSEGQAEKRNHPANDLERVS
ncbi:MAG: ATP-grasp domain-containing protein [Planctomycetota bacterium]|nr:ATP-grasp domain-containing protein [Planctomycetota bacterium]